MVPAPTWIRVASVSIAPKPEIVVLCGLSGASSGMLSTAFFELTVVCRKMMVMIQLVLAASVDPRFGRARPRMRR